MQDIDLVLRPKDILKYNFILKYLNLLTTYAFFSMQSCNNYAYRVGLSFTVFYNYKIDRYEVWIRCG